MCTSVAAINDVWKVSKSLIAVVALTAAEEDLRVFLHRHTLLPLKKKKRTHKSNHHDTFNPLNIAHLLFSATILLSLSLRLN